jgi:hypothetical protein
MLSRAFITGRLFGVGRCLHGAGGGEWWVCALWSGGSALLNLELKLMSMEFREDIPLSVPGRAGKMFVALRFSSGDCFTFE